MNRDDLRAVLTDAERARVDELQGMLERKPASQFLAGEYFKLDGSQGMSTGQTLRNGVYCVIHWKNDRLDVMRYGCRTRHEVPFYWPNGEERAFNKVPLELVVLSERAQERLVAKEAA